MKEKIQLIKRIQLWGGILIVGVAISITAIDIFGSYHAFNIHSEKMRKDYITNQEQMIKQEVERVVDWISYEKTQHEILIRKELQSSANNAFAIAQNIYQQNKSIKSKKEIQKMIIDALTPLRFSDGSGHCFATSMDGIAILVIDKPEMQSLNLLNVQDSEGKYIVKDMIGIIKQSGEGFYEYHEAKPNNKAVSLQKISFVTLFKPYNWLIGTELYIEDIHNQINTDLLSAISRIRFGKEGYIFVNRFNGNTLVSNGEIITGTKKLWEVFSKNPAKMKNIFKKEYRAALKPEGDYIYYSHVKMTDPNKESPKASFIYGLPSLQWLIGAGVYLDDVENDISLMQTNLNKQIKNEIIIFSTISLFILSLFLFIFNRLSHNLTNDTNIIISFFKKAACGNEKINRNLIRFDELDQLAANANKMLQDKVTAEQQLEMFKTFAESSSQGMGWANIDGIIKYLNPALTALLGETDQESSLEKNVATAYYPINEQQRLKETILPAVKKHGKWFGELTVQQTNGTLIPTLNSLFLIPDKTTGQVFLANIVSNITEWKEAEKEKEALTEKLYQAQKMESIGLMAGGVAHDLNNILSGIIGYPELILMDLPADSELRKPIEEIHQSGQRAATIVADLLTIARGASSVRKNYDINILINEYLNSPECQKLKSLHPHVIFQQQLKTKHSIISCSPVHIQKCLMNLIFNACEAIDDRGIVSISTHNHNVTDKEITAFGIKPGEYIILNVEDTGSGISIKDFKHIFEPFYTKKEMGRSGSGLGLAVVWNTMEDHGGKVAVESSKKGTCFKLYFPVNTENETLPDNSKEPPPITGHNEHILVVDDELQVRDIASKMLTQLGYHVDIVNSGKAAIKFVKKNPVDIILLDMLMEPGINGRQTYAEIVKLYPGQKAVIASGFSESVEVTTTLQLGAHEFIKKPYTMSQLGKAIQKALKS